VQRREAIVFLARREGSEILLLRRCAEHGGFWHPVSGSIDVAETPMAAAAREVAEETGLGDPASLHLLSETSYVYMRPTPPTTTETHVHCFLLLVPDDFSPILNWEHHEHRWCERTDALTLLHWENVGEALIRLLDLHNGS
jgi:8-oxo-dGTP pyrophosphatase MutT (NUDIX family)